MAHPRVQALLQRDSEGALYGYNIENILKEFDNIKEVTETDTQKK